MTLAEKIKRICPVGEAYRVKDVARILNVSCDDVTNAAMINRWLCFHIGDDGGYYVENLDVR